MAHVFYSRQRRGKAISKDVRRDESGEISLELALMVSSWWREETSIWVEKRTSVPGPQGVSAVVLSLAQLLDWIDVERISCGG